MPERKTRMEGSSDGNVAGSEGSNSIVNHSRLVHERKSNYGRTQDVFKKYDVIHVLGKGSIGSVMMVRVKDDKIGGSAFVKETGSKMFFGIFRKKQVTGRLSDDEISKDHVYALKSIILDQVSPTYIKEMENEIDILKGLDHPNIVRVHEVYQYPMQFYIVEELCCGGDLYRRVPYSEYDAADITYQILSAVRYLHERKIIHRDLKFENIMFESEDLDAKVKVIDFGLSTKVLFEGERLKERVGTLYTMSPQVLQRKYTSQADLWSIGVISFMLLSSSKPFYHRNRSKFIDEVMRAQYTFNSPGWKNVSNEAKDFVSKLLVIDPNERMTASEAIQHPWIVHRKKLPTEQPTEEVLAMIDNHLALYTEASDLKKIALNLIAHRSNASEIRALRDAFVECDTEHTGFLSYEEFKTALQTYTKYSDEDDILKIFTSIDTNRTGRIDFTEFLAATIEAQGAIAEDRIADAFDRLDSDDTGYISCKNLMEVLGDDCRKEDAMKIIQEVTGSTDSKGAKISYEQFLKAFRTKIHQEANEIAGGYSSDSDTSQELLTIDTSIPGGKEIHI